MCYIDGQKNKYSVLNECNRMLKYNIRTGVLCSVLPYGGASIMPVRIRNRNWKIIARKRRGPILVLYPADIEPKLVLYPADIE
jgi:hypothetical protein